MRQRKEKELCFPSMASFLLGQTCQDRLPTSLFSLFLLLSGTILGVWAFSWPVNPLLHFDLELLELASAEISET